jgi:hypothetical protein
MSRPGEAVLATAIVLLLLAGFSPKVLENARVEVITCLSGQTGTTVFLARHGRSFPLSSMYKAVTLRTILDRLDALASPGERVFVGPADLRRTNENETFIYHMLPQLRPATYFLEMNPRSANRPNSRLGQDIASADWLVLSHRFDEWNEPNKSAEFGSDQPMRVVQDQFELCGQYAGRDLYRRRTPAATKL